MRTNVKIEKRERATYVYVDILDIGRFVTSEIVCLRASEKAGARARARVSRCKENNLIR